jgi:hypothetical protein
VVTARDLPHSEELERSVLAGALIAPGDYVPELGAHGDSLFYLERHRVIARTLRELAEEGDGEPDPALLIARLDQRGLLERCGGREYVALLEVDLPELGRAPRHIKELVAFAKRRTAIVELERSLGRLRDGADVDAATERVRHLLAANGNLAGEDLVAEELRRERARREARRRLEAELRDTEPPEILSLAERLTRPRSAVAWRLPEWQPAEARVMLAGAAKSGKTHLVGNLVRALVDGDPWLGVEPEPIDGAVAILDLEMSERQLDDWLGAQRIRNADRVYPIPLRGRVASLDLLDRDTRRRWATWLRGRDVRYLVLDCLRPLMDAFGLDESSDAGRMLVALDQLLAEAEIPEALVAHHMGHGSERSRGDSRLRDWPDVEWRLVRQDPADLGSPRYLTAYGRDVDQPEQRLAYDHQARRLTLSGGSRRDAAADAALDAVVDTIEAAGAPLTARQVEGRLLDTEHSRAAIRDALRLGVTRRRLTRSYGPRRSHLYECAGAPDCAATAPAHSRECASAPIERRTRSAADEGLARRDEVLAQEAKP